MTDSNLIVSPEWLAANTENQQVVIIDCRFSLADAELGQKQYQESHIPGAFYLDLNRDLASPVEKHGGRHPLPNITKLADKLSLIGIKLQETLVVVYDDSRFAFAARLWWLLRYMGHSKVAVLDGGFSGWKAAGYAVTNILPESGEGEFVPELRSDLIVDMEAVKTRKELPGIVLVDSREGDRYLGLREPIDPIAGHIPGAVNYPWQDVTNERSKVRSPSEQKQRWMELETAEEIMVYCGSGVTACVNLLSLEIAGIPNAKLYPGSWSDWCSYQKH
ncbi:sulfurtransferase [Tychonema sp. BBK16]|uniref:sulfurtransferase n=1 Tax=Tychonema sp. BBK16 TaxID=2699888 RepID=UPI001F22B9B1|nr:sulfurtransferase [Tychonema sp. BBK16]MCF6372502.1 sulfurtransferase [Tychonema sp. BBK16]